MSDEPTAGAVATLRPGTSVEVLNRFTQEWARGFEVAAVDGQHYRLRRRGDGYLLPVLMPHAEVRRIR